MKKLVIFCFLISLCATFYANAETANTKATNEIDDAYVQKILSSQNESALDELINKGLDVNSTDKNGDTMLFYTLRHNKDLYMAKKLILAGADVNAPSANGMTPLIIATSKANELILQKMMIEAAGIKVKKEVLEQKLSEQIDFQMNRAIAMVQMLIEQGADVNQETPMGTPLMNASSTDWNADIVEILLKAGAQVNQKDRNGRTALFYAYSGNADEIITILLKAGADIAVKDKDGLTYMEIEKENLIKQ